jgi:hypothetical protein
MKNITTTTELKEAIHLLEVDRADKLELLKMEVNGVLENLKPANIIKNSIQHTLNSSNMKDNLIDGALGLITGYLSKKLLTGGESGNPIKNIFGNLIQFGIASLVSKNADEIKSTGRSFIKSILSKK